ncbi:hypothetical protein [Serratia silvae]|uniref:Fimbrial protein n=1 Tax=Serratia silvae TaxID=2824122 RepID=A0ABT0KC22_9GAMM|nr:hypothetical protein [Serratia silvae]MCL1029589.1 hypothetical protein [Serratia silvae]
MKYLISLFALLLVDASLNCALAALENKPYPIISNISNCSVAKYDDHWDVRFTVAWDKMTTLAPGKNWGNAMSRGILVFQFDHNGNMVNTSLPQEHITMMGFRATRIASIGSGVLFYGTEITYGWDNYDKHQADVMLKIYKPNVASVALQAANVYNEGFLLDEKGAVYFSSSVTIPDCPLITDTTKPPAIVNLTMNAPDWALGEIGTGKQQKVLTNSADRLCINYLSTESKDEDFIVNATSANGIVNNRFVLKHSLKPTNTLPYTLTLEGAGKQFILPNSNHSTVKFDSSANQTCFTPTFDLYGSDNQEPGDYSDVITYEIVTKS